MISTTTGSSAAAATAAASRPSPASRDRRRCCGAATAPTSRSPTCCALAADGDLGCRACHRRRRRAHRPRRGEPVQPLQPPADDRRRQPQRRRRPAPGPLRESIERYAIPSAARGCARSSQASWASAPRRSARWHSSSRESDRSVGSAPHSPGAMVGTRRSRQRRSWTVISEVRERPEEVRDVRSSRLVAGSPWHVRPRLCRRRLRQRATTAARSGSIEQQLERQRRPARSPCCCPDTKSSVRWETQDRQYLDEAFKAAGVEHTIVNAEGDPATQRQPGRAGHHERREGDPARRPRLRLGRGDHQERPHPGRQGHRLRPPDAGRRRRLLRLVQQRDGRQAAGPGPGEVPQGKARSPSSPSSTARRPTTTRRCSPTATTASSTRSTRPATSRRARTSRSPTGTTRRR